MGEDVTRRSGKASQRTVRSQPLPVLTVAPASLNDLNADLAREWLVTNGLGGYAMGSLCGATTRAYHGLLVAALTPPLGRTMFVTKVDETVITADGAQIALGTNEYADGTIDPRGFERLTAFALDGLIPTFTFWLGAGATLVKRLWMEHHHNLTYIQYTYEIDRTLATLATLPPGDSASRHARPSTPVPITLRLTPYCVTRDHHSSTHGVSDWRFLVEPYDSSQPEQASRTVRANPDAPAISLLVGSQARFEATGVWYWHVEHRAERARGLPDVEDVYQPGMFTATLAPGQTLTLVCATPLPTDDPELLASLGGDQHEQTVAEALRREQARQRALLDRANTLHPPKSADPNHALTQRLILAADQFLVMRRPNPTVPSLAPFPTREGREGVLEEIASSPLPRAGEGLGVVATVIAGYPWFTDWGRDTMIALPGLTLATGRYGEARNMLCCFLGAMKQGLIPNRFPDGSSDTAPDYNTADATLWLFHALDAYLTASEDWFLLAEVFDALDESIGWHERGTLYDIGVDPADGLLRAGAPGVQLTWMDAKVGDWVVTPRNGKPVEINALWRHALSLMARWAKRLGRDPARYESLGARVDASFQRRFWYEAGGYLYDVVDVDGVAGAVDWSLRPNQVIALAVAPTLIPRAQARRVLSLVERELLTPFGLRTLAPSDPRFIGAYAGDQRARDAAYHQGTIWPWLLGPYADAHATFFGGATLAEAIAKDVASVASDDIGEQAERAWRAALLAPFRVSIREGCLGSVSEIAEGAAPFALRGCPAQAWSVAELLRTALAGA